MTEQDFVGTWRLIAHESRTADGCVRYPFGRDAQGYLTYMADGYMSVAIMGTHRPRFHSANDLTEGTSEEQLDACKRYLSYAGTYILGEDSTILHHVDVSLFPNSRGGVQERLYRLEGERLTLSTRPVQIRGSFERRTWSLERASRSRVH